MGSDRLTKVATDIGAVIGPTVIGQKAGTGAVCGSCLWPTEGDQPPSAGWDVLTPNSTAGRGYRFLRFVLFIHPVTSKLRSLASLGKSHSLTREADQTQKAPAPTRPARIPDTASDTTHTCGRHTCHTCHTCREEWPVPKNKTRTRATSAKTK